jgi:hypothetical protein
MTEPWVNQAANKIERIELVTLLSLTAKLITTDSIDERKMLERELRGLLSRIRHVTGR